MHRRHFLNLIAAGTLAPLAARPAGATAADPALPARLARVHAGPVALRAEPSLAAPVVAMAPSCASGRMVTATPAVADGFRWVRFTLHETGRTGWIPTWHLAAIDV